MTNEALIIDALRTPIGKKDGALARWRLPSHAGQKIDDLQKS